MRRSIFLTVAFAALLLVISVLALAVWRNATRTQARVAALHSAHFEAGSALDSLRANVYLTGILTRDSLFDADPSHAYQYAGQFADIRSATTNSFRVLAASTQNGMESSALERLQRQVVAYLEPTRIVLNWTPVEKAARRAE